jgi:hypothetical protein
VNELTTETASRFETDRFVAAARRRMDGEGSDQFFAG